MKKIVTYIAHYWYAYLFAIACMVTAIVLDMMYPVITKSIIDDVIIKGKIELLGGLLTMIVVIGAGRSLGGYLKEFTFDVVSAKIGAKLRKDLFAHIEGLSMEYFDDTNTGELMARVKDDVDTVWNALGYVGMLMIEVVVHISMVLYCMFSLNWKLAFLPLGVMVLMGAVAIIMEQKLDKIFEAISEENARLTTIAEENLAGVRTVKAFAREKFEVQKFLSHNQQYYTLNMQQAKTLARFYPVFQFTGKLLPVVMVIIGGFQVIQGEMTLGSLVAFSEYCRNIVWPMETLGWLTNDLSSAVASCKKINKIYKQKPGILEQENPVVLEQVEGRVSFEGVSFFRGNQKILEDISFTLEPGKTLGVMGATGAGKTSLVNLLMRFFDVGSGSVKLDGVDVRELSLQQLRSSIGTVMQDVFLFSDTISENIRMGRRAALDRPAMVHAAGLAQAKGFIEGMPEAYETVIGERGVGLSGGQKQRISIARAIAKQNPVLILDDSTSALDMETEYEIQKSLDTLDATKIIIAHRISAVRRADEIIFLEDGKVKERGTHEELLAQKGLYYGTYVAQMGTAPEKRKQV
ncbi:MAG: ABC transporter ATP-binding protein [Lachnospiraceae bacterium]|jgi:ATP-binding cassette subfamily B multidrug efflux pump|nr:ABC transporter ATP-binding protein [Lachnospiraceae bacterium]